MCPLLGIHSRSTYKKLKEEVMGHYFKESDDEIFELIKPIIQARPSYGYKRITAILNRQRLEFRLPRYNKKRIYRIMKLNWAILPKSLRTREHQPTGVVMTLYSNARWCSDGFEKKCFNGEKVYVAFVLNRCDREAISCVASTRPLIPEDIQSLIIDLVEKKWWSQGKQTD